MWSLARVLAALETKHPAPPLRVVADFKAPLELPAIARLRHGRDGNKRAFFFEPHGGGRPYLRGTVEPHHPGS
jgi:hypothetical protein